MEIPNGYKACIKTKDEREDQVWRGKNRMKNPPDECEKWALSRAMEGQQKVDPLRRNARPQISRTLDKMASATNPDGQIRGLEANLGKSVAKYKHMSKFDGPKLNKSTLETENPKRRHAEIATLEFASRDDLIAANTENNMEEFGNRVSKHKHMGPEMEQKLGNGKSETEKPRRPREKSLKQGWDGCEEHNGTQQRDECQLIEHNEDKDAVECQMCAEWIPKKCMVNLNKKHQYRIHEENHEVEWSGGRRICATGRQQDAKPKYCDQVTPGGGVEIGC